MRLRIFLLNWKGFAAKTDKEIVVNIFVDLKLDLQLFCPGRAKWREKFGLDLFVRRGQGRGIGLRVFLSKSKRRGGVK